MDKHRVGAAAVIAQAAAGLALSIGEPGVGAEAPGHRVLPDSGPERTYCGDPASRELAGLQILVPTHVHDTAALSVTELAVVESVDANRSG